MEILGFISLLVTWIFICFNRNPVQAETDIQWPQSASFVQNDLSPDTRAHYDNGGAMPEGRLLHKIKKIKKKQFLLCLLGGGGKRVRDMRSVPAAEGKLFFPIVQQHTDVNVGGSGLHGYEGSDGNEHGSSGGCGHILNSGIGQLGHPLLGGFGSLLGGDQGSASNDENRLHRNFNRNIIRPIHKSMKHIYRYFK